MHDVTDCLATAILAVAKRRKILSVEKNPKGNPYASNTDDFKWSIRECLRQPVLSLIRSTIPVAEFLETGWLGKFRAVALYAYVYASATSSLKKPLRKQLAAPCIDVVARPIWSARITPKPT